MISNLRPRSNLLPGKRYQECFDTLSAFDLYDINRRCPFLPIVFDPACYSLSEQQIKEWEGHLFWGDRQVHMKDDDRAAGWIWETRRELLCSWQSYSEELDEEKAFEALWLLTALPLGQPELELGQAAVEVLMRFLIGDPYRYSAKDIEQRLASFERRTEGD